MSLIAKCHECPNQQAFHTMFSTLRSVKNGYDQRVCRTCYLAKHAPKTNKSRNRVNDLLMIEWFKSELQGVAA